MEFTQFSLFLLFFLFWKSLKMCSLKFHSELTKCGTGKTEISDSNLESFEFLPEFEKIEASVGSRLRTLKSEERSRKFDEVESPITGIWRKFPIRGIKILNHHDKKPKISKLPNLISGFNWGFFEDFSASKIPNPTHFYWGFSVIRNPHPRRFLI